MEDAELSSSVIFVCHVNFSRRLEAESAAISVLFHAKNHFVRPPGLWEYEYESGLWSPIKAVHGHRPLLI